MRATLSPEHIIVTDGHDTTIIPWTADDSHEWGWIAAENLLGERGFLLVEKPNGAVTLEVRRAL